MTLYAVLVLAWFLVPGFLIAHAIGLGTMALKLALPLSYALLVVNVFAARYFAVDVGVFANVLYLELLALVLLVPLVHRMPPSAIAASLRRSFDTAAAAVRDNSATAMLFVALFTVLSGYLLWAGPYTEVPSDFWTHVGKTQYEYLALSEEGTFRGFADWREFGGKAAAYWYAIQAFLCHAAGITVEQSFAPQAFVNSMLMLVAVYLFTNRILRGGTLGTFARHGAAALAVVFFLLHFGTSVFSFVRYYTFGPVFFNYVVYLTFIVLVLDFLGPSREPKAAFVPLFAILGALMGVIHLQELLFAVILGYAILAVTWLRRSVFGEPRIEGDAGQGSAMSPRQLDLLFYGATILAAVAAIATHVLLDRHDPMAFNRMVRLETLLPFTDNLYVLDPNKQFYETLTPWGYLVGVLFLLHWNRFRANPVLVAGMLNPLYTVLNPVFTDLFLRVSWPELVWRFLYIMPFAITGGVLAAHALVAVFGRVRPIRKAYGFAVTAALVALLFPVKTTFFDSPYSKFYTLAPVAAENDHRNWRDLYAYLNELDRTYSILTDPVTGYTVRALTGHTYHGAKFHTYHWGGYQDFNDPPYELDDFRRYHGWLFVINRRDGGYSETGRVSRHWRDVQLEVHRYYRGGLVEFVEANPQVFRRVWEQDAVRIYEIDFSGVG